MSQILKEVHRWRGVLVLAGGITALGGCATASSVSTQQELQLGQQAAAQANAQLPIVQNAAINSYINQLGNSIAARVDPRGLRYTFYVVNADEVNAFAIPGGYVYINRGLIERASNMAEVAGVLGHEIAHVVERHSIEQMAQQQNASLGVNLAYILMGRAPSGVEQAALQVGAGALFARYSRHDEAEADQDAVRFMVQSGIDPRGLVTMFQKLLAERQSSPGSVEQWFSTHPMEEDRIAAVQQAINRLPAGTLNGLTTDTQAFEQFKRQVRALPAAPR